MLNYSVSVTELNLFNENIDSCSQCINDLISQGRMMMYYHSKYFVPLINKNKCLLAKLMSYTQYRMSYHVVGIYYVIRNVKI